MPLSEFRRKKRDFSENLAQKELKTKATTSNANAEPGIKPFNK